MSTPTTSTAPPPKVVMRPIIRRPPAGTGTSPQIIRRTDSDSTSPASPRGSKNLEEGNTSPLQRTQSTAIRRPIINTSNNTTNGSPQSPSTPTNAPKMLVRNKKPHEVPLEESTSTSPASPALEAKIQARKSLPRETTLSAESTPPGTPRAPDEIVSLDQSQQDPTKKVPSVRVPGNRKSTGSALALKDVFGTPPTPESPPMNANSISPESARLANMKIKSVNRNLIKVGGVEFQMPSKPSSRISMGTPTAKVSDDIFASDTTSSGSEEQTDEHSSTSVDDDCTSDVEASPRVSIPSPTTTSPTPIPKRLVNDANQRPRRNSGTTSSSRRRGVSGANLVIENPLKWMPENVDTATYDITPEEILESYNIRLTTREKSNEEKNGENNVKQEDENIGNENIINVYTDEEEEEESLEDFIHTLKTWKNDPSRSDRMDLSFRHFVKNPLYNVQRARDIDLEACFTLEETIGYNEVILRIIENGLDPNNHVVFTQELENAENSNEKLSAQQRSALLTRKTTTSRRYSRAIAAVLLRSTALQPKDIEDITRQHTPEKILKVAESHFSLATCSPNWKEQAKNIKNKKNVVEVCNLSSRSSVYQPEWQTQLQRERSCVPAANAHVN